MTVSIRVWAHVLFSLLLATVLHGIADAGSAKTAGGETHGYRLSGVMRVGDDKIGFLEVPAGGQILVRQGSVIDGGKVTVLSDREMRIEFPTRSIVLELEAGAGSPSAMPISDSVKSQEDFDNVHMRQVDKEQLAAALKEIRKPAASSAGESGSKATDIDLSRRFAAVTHLPPNSRIMAVNEKPVSSAANLISMVDQHLSQGQSIVLTLESRPGERPGRVYLNLQSD